jgi:hypothetical protein
MVSGPGPVVMNVWARGRVGGGGQVQLMSHHNVKVSHCPAAAMRMLGFAPIVEMQEAGVCVSLGTDGAPSNNRMSLGERLTPTAPLMPKQLA